MSAGKLLITGATGKLGQIVMSYLLDTLKVAPGQLIATSRNIEKLDALKAQGVEVRAADFADPDSLQKAFSGADRLLLISMDTVGERDKLHANAVKAAEAAGVQHLVYTSMPSANDSPVVFAFEHEATEKAIENSTIPGWTILRNNWYFENLPEFFAATLQTSMWLTAAAQGKVAQISRVDLGKAAAIALASAQTGKSVVTLNGPESLTVDEMADKIDAVLGTTTQVIHLSDEALRSQFETFQLPQEIIAMTTSLDKHNRENRSNGTSEAFEALTGFAPQTFESWLIENKAQLLEIARPGTLQAS